MIDKNALRAFLLQRLPEGLDILQNMVGINSFTGNPQGVNTLAEYTAQVFAPLGFSAEYVPSENPEFGNHLVLQRAGRSGRNIVMVSHLDTVFPPEEEQRNNFRWSVEGDRIFGPGTQDIKGGTVMIWLVLLSLQRFAPTVFADTSWTVLLDAAEERFCPDFGELCKARMNSGTAAALVFESEGKGNTAYNMVLARKGRATWRVTANGRAAHAGGKHKHGANAIQQLGLTIQKIQALTDYSKNLTFNVGTIQGGTVSNRVPHEAVAEGEFRAFTPENFLEGKRNLLALGGNGEIRSADDGFPCCVKVEVLTETRPWPRNPGTDMLYEFWRKAGQEVQSPTGWEERGGLSDGNLIWDVVPTLDGLGPWGDNDHCSERSEDGSKLPEYVDASRFVPKAMVNTTAILHLLTPSFRQTDHS